MCLLFVTNGGIMMKTSTKDSRKERKRRGDDRVKKPTKKE